MMIKRILIWLLGTVVVLVVAIVLAFRFTPWPSVAIIQQAFSRGDQASEAALKKHVPNNVVTRRDITYGKGLGPVSAECGRCPWPRVMRSGTSLAILD